MTELTAEELEMLNKKDESSDIVLPTATSDDNKEPAGSNKEIAQLLLKEQVGNVVIKEESTIKVPSYLIVCSETPTIHGCWESLCSMLGGGDTTVYVKGVNGTIKELGAGNNNVLCRVIISVVQNVLGPDFKVYRNLGDGFKLVKPGDMSMLRLNL